MAKVAFVLSVYNKEAWIAQTIRSIQKQTFKDIEIIVWNDGSTDHSMDIVKLLAKDDKRIILGGTDYNQGISKAYNQAHKLITAPYVCISSADDIYDRRRAQITKDIFDKDSRKQIMYGWFWRVDPALKPLEHKMPGVFNKEKLNLPNNQYIPHGFMSVCTNVLKMCPYDENLKYGIDYPWLKDLAEQYPPICWKRVKADMGMYRWIPSNVSHTHRKTIWEQDNK